MLARALRRGGAATSAICARGVRRFEDRVELAAILEHFPRAFEACGNHETVAGAERVRASGRGYDPHASLREMAKLRLGVLDAPLASSARPSPRKELLTRIGVVVR